MAFVVGGVVASMLAGIGLGGVSSVLLSGSSGIVASKLSVRLAGGRAEPVPTSGAAVFRQASKDTCGPAALSWALFVLGDWVFETELAHHAGKHNLEELASIAAGRGFETTVFSGGVDDLRPRRDTVYLLHIRPEHFVGCVPSDDGSFAIFDPKPGLVTTVSVKELAEHWSGYAVAITLPTSEAVLEGLQTGL